MSESEWRLPKEKMQRIFINIMNGSLETVEPEIDFGDGVTYPKMEKLLGSKKDAYPVLAELEEKEIFISKLAGNIAVCPTCGSHNMILIFNCPSCGSSKIVKSVMWQHLKCGHVDFESSFKVEGKLVCPRCLKTLEKVDEDYKVHSLLFSCSDCGASFSNPKQSFTCSQGHVFINEEVEVKPVKVYHFNQEKRNLLEKLTVDFGKLFKPLIEKGWVIEAPSKLPGVSGNIHELPYALWNSGGKRGEDKKPSIVGSISVSESDIRSEEILALWAKAIDINAENVMFLAVPRLNGEGRKIAKNLAIKVVEGKNISELQEAIKNMAAQLTETKGK